MNIILKFSISHQQTSELLLFRISVVFFFFCFNLRVQVVVSFLSVTEAEVEKPQG